MKKLKIFILAIVTILISIIMILKPQEVYAAEGLPKSAKRDEYQFGAYIFEHTKTFVKMNPSLVIGIAFDELNTSHATYSLPSVSCIDLDTYTSARKNNPYQIINIIDIGRTNPLSVDVYKSTGKPGVFKKYSATDSASKKAGARMAYYASRKTNEGVQEGGIRGTFSQIYKAHKKWFYASIEHRYSDDTMQSGQMPKDAVKYQKSVEEGYTAIAKVSQDSDVVITPKTDKKGKITYTVIGPFKASFKGGTIGSPTLILYDKSGNQISKTTGNVVNSTGKKSATIKSNKNFYIKYSGALPSNFASLSLSLQHKSPLMYRAVVCLLSNKKSKMNVGQNFAAYGAYSTRKKKTIKWGTGITDTHLKIQKVGEDGEAVKDTGFKLIYNGGYVTTPFNWTNYATDTTDGAIIFKTGNDGLISLEGIPEGTYQAEEIYIYDENSKYSAQAQASNRFTDTIEITGEQDEDDNDTLTLTKVNHKYTNLRVHKVVKGSNPEKTIDGVTFKIMAQNEETAGTYKWVQSYTFGQPSAFTYTDDENQAATYTTVGGNIDFANIPVGTYKAKEISIPEDLPYGKDPSWPDNISPEIYCAPKNDSNYDSYNNLTITCQNPWFIKIAGYVYSPEKSGKNEQSILSREGTTDYKSSDYRVANAKVTLYKGGSPYKFNTDGKSGESNCETTDENGYYEYTIQIFNETDVDDLAIEFTYDGLDFIAVNPNYIDKAYPDEKLKDGATSKAKENSVTREKLNQGYSEIKGVKEPEEPKEPELETYGYAVQSSDSSEKELTYKFDKNEGSGEQTTGTSKSTLQNMNTGMEDDKEKKIRKINSGEIKNQITAVYALNGKETQEDKYNYTYYDLRTESNSSNPNVLKKVIQLNLGLIKRDQPNLEVSNQIYNVKATINGFENTYQTVGTLKKSENQLNVGVTYVNEGQLADFPVYASDVQSIEENKNNKLEMYITYKVKVTNFSQTLYSKVNEMAIFSDPNYELVSVKDKSGNDITHSDTSTRRTAGLTEKRGEDTLTYNVQYADISNMNPKPLDDSAKDENNTPSENYDEFYITYKISDDELVKMITADGTSTKYIPQFKNIVEINSYSTYEDSGRTKLYAGIDVDSAPGNVAKEIDTTSLERDMSEMTDDERQEHKLEKRKGMTSMFDNDTGYAEEFTIHIKGKRSIEGTVFLDNSTSSGRGNERTSNGLLEDGENKLKNVQVYLREIDSNNEDGTANIVVNERRRNCSKRKWNARRIICNYR